MKISPIELAVVDEVPKSKVVETGIGLSRAIEAGTKWFEQPESRKQSKDKTGEKSVVPSLAVGAGEFTELELEFKNPKV